MNPSALPRRAHMSKHDVRTKFIAATPGGGRRHRKISEEKSKLIESTNYLHWLLALALLLLRRLARPRRDASPAGADRVDAVIPPDPAVAGSKRMTKKSARAGVEAAEPSANT